MRKFIKWVVILSLVLLLGLGVMVLIGRGMYKGTPDYYKSYEWTGQERSVLSQRAADKFLRARQMVQQAHFGEVRAQRAASAGSGAATRPAGQTADSAGLTISFTEEELNAFLFHNSETFQEWKKKYEQYVSDPGIFLEDGRLILAAKSKDLGAVMSMHFVPSIDDSGRLHLKPVGAYGGRLPLPDALLRPYVEKLRNWIGFRMPAWVREAKLDQNGGFNSSAAAMGLARLLMNSLEGTPAEPVLFMPVDEGETSAPLKISEIAVKNGALSPAVWNGTSES